MIQSDDAKKKTEKIGPLIIFFVGVHSLILGCVIYFFTDFFYRTFFAAPVENIFFVRQSGVFLFLAGLFYLYPLVNLRKYYNLILLVIVSKIVAVYFLVANAKFTMAPSMIYLAAFFDGLMCLFLILTYVSCRKKFNRVNEGVLKDGHYAVTEN